MKRLFSVFDNKSREFGPVFCFATSEAAIRWFEDALENQRHIVDLDLYEIGSFDEFNGEIYQTHEDKPILIKSGDEVFNEIMEKSNDNAAKLRLQELGEMISNLSEEDRENLIKKAKEMKANEKAL